MSETTARPAPVVGNLSVRKVRDLADVIGDIGETARTRPAHGDDTRRTVHTSEGHAVDRFTLPGGASVSCDLGRVGDRWQATVTLSSPGGRHRETGKAYRAPHAAARDALTDMAAWLLYQANRFGAELGAAPVADACSLCGKPADAHVCPVAPTLEDHFTAAEFYGGCSGDASVWSALYPEVAPASQELGALLAPEGVPVERSEYRRACSELVSMINTRDGDALYIAVARFSQAATRAQAGLTDFEVAEVRALRKSGEVPAEVEAVWRETLRIFTGAEMSDADALRSEIARHRAEAGRRTGAGSRAAEANAERFEGVLSRLLGLES